MQETPDQTVDAGVYLSDRIGDLHPMSDRVTPANAAVYQTADAGDTIRQRMQSFHQTADAGESTVDADAGEGLLHFRQLDASAV